MLTKFLVNGLQQTLHALELVVNRIDGLIDPFPEQPDHDQIFADVSQALAQQISGRPSPH